MNQAQVEALYSQRNNHEMLHRDIKSQLETTFAPVALRAYLRILEWLDVEYYDSKAARIAELKLDISKRGLDRLVVAIVATVVHTKNTQTLQQACGYLGNHLPFEDPFDRATTAAELLALCQHKGGLYEINKNEQGRPATIQVNHWQFVEKNLLSSYDWINDTHFNPPLIEPPKLITDNNSCGYHTITEPVILGSLTSHPYQLNYDSLNALNEIEWVLDQDVLAEPEVPSKPITDQHEHQLFRQMVHQSNQVYSLLGCRPFYFAWQADSRGRVYSHGYHVNLQAAEYKKACLSFNKYEVLT